jgi:hypothetical protein
MRILTFLFAVMPQFVLAGTISAGGGKLYKFSHNPWFLENTDQVTYCIRTSEEFAVSETRLNEIVLEGISKWQAVFDYGRDDYYEPGEIEPYGAVRVATQSFASNCEAPDISFQFGILDDEQLTFFDNVNDYVGAAVRTDYDLESMRSRGFVYVAPLSGDLKPDSRDIHPEAWGAANNAALRLVVWHELGHVFGLKHDANRAWESIMYDRIPEAVITMDMVRGLGEDAEYFFKLYDPLNIAKAKAFDEVFGCRDASPISVHGMRYFSIPDGFECSKLAFSGDGIDFYAASTRGEPYVKFGHLFVNISGLHQTDLIQVNIPREQKVFTKLPDEVTRFSLAPLRGELVEEYIYRTGRYTPQRGGEPLAIKLHISRGYELQSTVATKNMKLHDHLIRYWGPDNR